MFIYRGEDYMKGNRVFYAIILMLFFIQLSNEDINGQSRGAFGIRTGIYTDLSDLFIGGEYLAPIGSRIFLNPNIEYIFVADGSYWTFNLDAHYDFPTYSDVYVWTGGGIGILHFSPKGPPDATTNVGLNLLFGLGFGTASTIIPYVQGKAIISDNTDFEFGLGIRF